MASAASAAHNAGMSNPHAANSDETNALIRRAAAGDDTAWGAIVREHEPRLRTIIRLRLDPRLNGVIDPSDVLQETYKVVLKRLADYAEGPKHPFFLWLRYVAGDQLARAHRRHLGTKKRRPNGRLEPIPDASSVNMAGLLVGRENAPVDVAIREERRQRVVQALDALTADDREVLVLRHFEQLTALEAATLLHITEAAARKRYLRALERISDILKGGDGLPGLLS